MSKPLSYILQIDKYVVFKCDLEKWQKNIGFKIFDGLSIENVDSQNIKDVEKFRGKSVLQASRKYYNDGCLGVYAYINGTVVGHQWAEINNTGKYDLSKEGVLLLPGEGGMWYGNVAEEHRGKRIHSHFRNKLHERVKRLGCKMLISHNLKDNEAVIRANRRFLRTNFTSTAIKIKALLNIITIYKSSDRWYVLLQLPRLSKGICIAQSKPYGLKLLLPKL